MTTKVTKVIVNLPDETVNSLSRLAAFEDTTLTEALRRAVHRQQFLEREMQQGNKLLLRNPVTKECRRVIFNHRPCG